MKVKAYMCGTDWNTDLPLGANDVKLYTSLEVFKKTRTCWQECGIVEVKIIKTKTIKKGKL